jgi:hypothetical protein
LHFECQILAYGANQISGRMDDGYIDGYVVLQLVAAKYSLIYLTRRLVGEVSTRLQVQVAILCSGRGPSSPADKYHLTSSPRSIPEI